MVMSVLHWLIARRHVLASILFGTKAFSEELRASFRSLR
jgi:hypothetical protein